MARGEKEQACLDYVKNIIFSQQNICYVCSIADDDLIEQMFQTASPNVDLNSFPDFICNGGFIEQFEVTSSHSNRNGSTMKREQDKIGRAHV